MLQRVLDFAYLHEVQPVLVNAPEGPVKLVVFGTQIDSDHRFSGLFGRQLDFVAEGLMVEALLSNANFRLGLPVDEVFGRDANGGANVSVEVVEEGGEPVEFDAFDFDARVGELVVGVGRQTRLIAAEKTAKYKLDRCNFYPKSNFSKISKRYLMHSFGSSLRFY